ncbi:hypothetical protein BD779DRAFT_1678179 [Infundibulicybe gibba]|nr:hypothetical protein BD779DRAFT_1678179 [Infundibulicybe gibba]
MPASRSGKRRGQSNPDVTRRKKEAWVASGGPQRAKERLKKITTRDEPTSYPGDLIGVRSGIKVRKIIAANYPGVNAATLPNVTPTGRYFVPLPAGMAPCPGHPPYLAMRFDCIVNEATQQRLLNAWTHLNTTPVVFPKPNARHGNRSGTPALHLGVWETYQSTPFVTLDTRQKDASAATAIDALLSIVGEDIAPRLMRLLKVECPVQYERQLLAYDRVKSLLQSEFECRPALDFQGAFFAVAVKEGSSEIIHLDFHDFKHSITWIVPLGDWEGGEFCIPQLGIKIPVHAGQVLGAMTGVFAHCSAPVTQGYRVILTLFSENCLVKHGTA